MRIRNETFLFSIDLKHHHTGRVDIYDAGFNQLITRRSLNTNIERIEIDICLPNRLIVVVSKEHDVGKIELVKMRLAGIDIAQENMLKILDYRQASISKYTSHTLDQVLSLPAHKLSLWENEGYATIDLFHPDPFALHLFIGNKINF